MFLPIDDSICSVFDPLMANESYQTAAEMCRKQVFRLLLKTPFQKSMTEREWYLQ